MAYANRFTGEGLVIKVTPTGGSLLTLTDDYTAFEWTLTDDNVDVTAGNERERSFLVTKQGMSWSLTAFGGDDDVWFAMNASPSGVMEVYRHGVVNGEEFFSFNYILESQNPSTAHDAAEELTISGQRNGEMIDDFGSVQGGVPHLSFFVQPVNTAADAIIGDTAGVVVRVLDADNALMTSDNSSLITIAIGTNPAAGVLSGIMVVRVVAGVASFGNLTIDDTATGYTLSATSPGLTSATSSMFNIT